MRTVLAYSHLCFHSWCPSAKTLSSETMNCTNTGCQRHVVPVLLATTHKPWSTICQPGHSIAIARVHNDCAWTAAPNIWLFDTRVSGSVFWCAELCLADPHVHRPHRAGHYEYDGFAMNLPSARCSEAFLCDDACHASRRNRTAIAIRWEQIARSGDSPNCNIGGASDPLRRRGCLRWVSLCSCGV